MKTDFARLSHLLASDPERYRAEISQLRRERPEEFSAYVNSLRDALSTANEQEDRPLTADETEALIENTCHALRWSRTRVIAEGVLRLRNAALYGDEPFKPLTPPEQLAERKGRYLRRYSSLEAIVLGEVRAARPRTSISRPSGRRRIDPRRDEDPVDPRREAVADEDHVPPHAVKNLR